MLVTWGVERCQRRDGELPFWHYGGILALDKQSSPSGGHIRKADLRRWKNASGWRGGTGLKVAARKVAHWWVKLKFSPHWRFERHPWQEVENYWITVRKSARREREWIIMANICLTSNQYTDSKNPLERMISSHHKFVKKKKN